VLKSGINFRLYSNLSFRVIVNSHSLSNAFPSNVGVFQGDNLSPNLFNLYINGLIDDFDHSCSPVLLGLTVWSNICIKFGVEQGILLNIFFNLKNAF
jgi:hypothetical protein